MTVGQGLKTDERKEDRAQTMTGRTMRVQKERSEATRKQWDYWIGDPWNRQTEYGDRQSTGVSDAVKFGPVSAPTEDDVPHLVCWRA